MGPPLWHTQNHTSPSPSEAALVIEETSHDTEASQSLLLQDFDPLKERLDLLEVFWRQGQLLLAVIHNRTSIRVDSERGIHIPSIKPLGMLVLNRVNQVVLEELFLLILAKLDTTTTQDRSTVTTRVWF
jgi:microsomal dipeptidase-like Zn-dependent dipeptidase